MKCEDSEVVYSSHWFGISKNCKKWIISILRGRTKNKLLTRSKASSTENPQKRTVQEEAKGGKKRISSIMISDELLPSEYITLKTVR